MKLLPLRHGSKIPAAKDGESWKDLISDRLQDHELWQARGWNLGLALAENGRSVIDFDDKEAGRDFFRKHKEICTQIVETRRGVHFHFSGQTQTRKFDAGDIKGNGYTVWPESIVKRFRYRLIELGELQPFPEHLYPIEQKPSSTRKEISNAASYIKKIQSIQGENGSASLIRAIARCRDAGLTEAEATILILEWNETNATPPWPHTELARAITRTYRRT